MGQKMKINEEKLARAEAVHYDFCTRKYRGNAVFYRNNLVSVYLRENGARTGGGIIRLSWSLVEEATGTGCSDGTDPEAVQGEINIRANRNGARAPSSRCHSAGGLMMVGKNILSTGASPPERKLKMYNKIDPTSARE